MNYVIPINEAQQCEVIEQTEHFIRLGSKLFGHDFSVIPVAFDLRGRTAGMYKVKERVGASTKNKKGRWGWFSYEGKQRYREIRYNPWIFAKYYQENLTVTVPHEVAHYLVDCLHHRSRRVRPHGSEWKAVMDAFGVDDGVTANFDLVGIPTRQHRQFEYRCDCKTHQLGSRRHHKVLNREASYLCRYCGVTLQQALVVL